jgi:hypothetical protein
VRGPTAPIGAPPRESGRVGRAFGRSRARPRDRLVSDPAAVVALILRVPGEGVVSGLPEAGAAPPGLSWPASADPVPACPVRLFCARRRILPMPGVCDRPDASAAPAQSSARSGDRRHP